MTARRIFLLTALVLSSIGAGRALASQGACDCGDCQCAAPCPCSSH